MWGSRWDLMDQQSSTVVVSKDDGEGGRGRGRGTVDVIVSCVLQPESLKRVRSEKDLGFVNVAAVGVP